MFSFRQTQFSSRANRGLVFFFVLAVFLIRGFAAVIDGMSQDNASAVVAFVVVLLIAATVIAVAAWVRKLSARNHFIDAKLDALLHGVDSFQAYNKTLPRFRFVDLYNAAANTALDVPGWVELDTAHVEPLASILNGRFYQPGNRQMRRPEMSSRVVGPGKDKFFPQDRFWVYPHSAAFRDAGQACVIRVKQGPALHLSTIEVAARTAAEGTALIERIVQRAADHSIYRNHLLDLEFAGEVRDDEGNIEQNENIDLVFKPSPAVGPGDIVMEEDVSRVLERNVLDFHRRRGVLTALGLPSRRGVLLFGPPGTGKTYTCKYLATQMAGTITTLVASGESLLRVRTICNLARMLQPALVVLEDVDLVYASRESGLGHNASLGKLMDELDGFGRDDQIIFILTTNAIDRVERAITDRPGRISQCVFLGPPSDPLRRRYLQALLARYDGSAVDMTRLTEMTGGTTQAFLKELVFRAVQIASQNTPPPPAQNVQPVPGQGVAISPAARMQLGDAHFAEAMAEMRGAGGRAGETIIGFRTVGF